MASWRDSTIGRRLIANSSWLFAAEGLALALRLVSGFVLARILGVTEFGRLALVIAFVTLLTQLLDFRTWETLIRYVIRFVDAGERDKARAIVKLCYSLDLVAAALACTVLAVIAPLGARVFLRDEASAPLIRLFAMTVPLALPSITASALLRAADLFRLLAIKNLVTAFVRAAALTAAAALGADLSDLVLLHVALAALELGSSLTLAMFATSKLDIGGWWFVRLALLRGERRQLVRFLGFTNVAAVLKVVQGQLDVLLVGHFLPTQGAGYVSLARSLTDAMRFLAAPVNTAAYPEYARLWDQQDLGKIRRITRSLLQVTSFVAVGALVVVSVTASPAVEHLAGRDYLPAVPVVYWLALGTALEIPTAIFHPMLVAAERTSTSMLVLAFAIVVRLSTLVMLIQSQGELAAGIAHLVYAVTYAALASVATTRAMRDREKRGVR